MKTWATKHCIELWKTGERAGVYLKQKVQLIPIKGTSQRCPKLAKRNQSAWKPSTHNSNTQLTMRIAENNRNADDGSPLLQIGVLLSHTNRRTMEPHLPGFKKEMY
jgi:hypothetical protein